MESLFHKDPTNRPAPTAYERIGPEIAHLKKKGSVRDPGKPDRFSPSFFSSAAVCLFLVLFFMDPFLYALHKGEAIRAYIYLYNYGGANNPKIPPLLAAGIFRPDEVEAMNNLRGSYQDYFSGVPQAEAQVDSAINYLNSVENLRAGHYEQLDPIGKLRYVLFVRNGLRPPIYWDGLAPSVSQE